MATDGCLNLIGRYVGRQAIVLEALMALRPDLVMAAKTGVTRESIRVAHLYKDTPFSGNWDGKWTYFIHGSGCQLVEISTGEPIEWDAPDLNTFDKYWFVNWVRWFAESALDSDFADEQFREIARRQDGSLETFIFGELEHLRQSGRLSMQELYHTRYQLLT